MMQPLNQPSEQKKSSVKKGDPMVTFMVVSGLMILSLLLVANAILLPR